MAINSFVRQLQKELPEWRPDEIIIIANHVLNGNASQKMSYKKLQCHLNELNRYVSSLESVKEKTASEVKDAIKTVAAKIYKLDNENKQLLWRFNDCIKKLLSELDKYAGFINSIKQEYEEGNKKEAFHFHIERNKKLIMLKKLKFINQHGKLFCEVCNFDFYKFYGMRGKDFAEVHHNIPITSKKFLGYTSIDDLTILCSNCHRMIHRHNPWLSIQELKKIINKKNAA